MIRGSRRRTINSAGFWRCKATIRRGWSRSKTRVALNAEYPEPHYLLGKIYHRLGNDPLSKTEIARFTELKKRQ